MSKKSCITSALSSEQLITWKSSNCTALTQSVCSCREKDKDKWTNDPKRQFHCYAKIYNVQDTIISHTVMVVKGVRKKLHMDMWAIQI